MSLPQLMVGMGDTLTPLLSPMKVKSHGGQFTEREIALLLGDSPAVLIAALNLGDFAPNDEQDGFQTAGRFAAYCIGVATATDTSTETAMTAAQTVINALLTDQTWGVPALCTPPELTSIAAEAVYSGHINVLSVAIWAVTWTQNFEFTRT